jgi:hypothetical protein
MSACWTPLRVEKQVFRVTPLSATIDSWMTLDNLAGLKDDMIAFIAGHGLRRMNAYVTEDIASVVLEDDDADAWKDFVEHAKAAQVPFLTMSEVTLEPEDVSILIEQIRDQSFPDADAPEFFDAEDLRRHIGKTGYLQLGFAQQGVMFLFETSTEWYEQFQALLEAMSDLGGLTVDDGDHE